MRYAVKVKSRYLSYGIGLVLGLMSLNSGAIVVDGALSGTITVVYDPCKGLPKGRICLAIYNPKREVSVNVSVSNSQVTVSYGLPFETVAEGRRSTTLRQNGVVVGGTPVVSTNSITFNTSGMTTLDYTDFLVPAGIRFFSGYTLYTTTSSNPWRIRSLKCYLSPNNSDDTDSDGFNDCEEQPGISVGSNPLNKNLALYDWGARVKQKDIFVEVDYMEDEAGRVDPYLRPTRAALQKVVDAYASHNVQVHFDVGDLLQQSPGLSPLNFDLGGGNSLPFSEPSDYDTALSSRLANMDATRKDYFHYMLFASAQQVGQPGSSGYGSYDLSLPANTTLITLGRWTSLNSAVISNYQAGTIMHELGHNFGLRHGGFEDQNQKPNYISVMNYLYQFLGIPVNGAELNQRYGFGWWDNYNWPVGCQYGSLYSMTKGPLDPNMLITYSDGTHSVLDEPFLAERSGVTIAAPVAMDFNCDGYTNSPNNGDMDTNHDGVISSLSDYNDWDTNGWLMYFYYAKHPIQSILPIDPIPLVEFSPPQRFFDELSQIQ